MNNYVFQSNEELIKYQEQMQSDSDWILNRLDLVTLLQEYGGVKIVGAKTLNLMVARDIDISVIVPKIDFKIWQEIVSKLMVTKHVRKVTAVDEYDYDEENIYDPKKGKKYSLYIEMNTVLGPDLNKNNSWEIQIHLITKVKFDENIIKDLKVKLNDKNRLTILKLKWWANKVNKTLLFVSNGHFKIQSIWIYEAVLDHEIINIKAFVEFLRSKISEKDKNLLSIIETTD